MAEIPELIWRMFDLILQGVEEEQIILEEILMEDGDFVIPYEAGNVQEQLEEVIEHFLGDLFLLEMVEMLNEEEELMELMYAPAERQIEWQRDLPRMDYFRALEDPYFEAHFRMDRPAFEMLIVELGNHLVDHNRLLRLRTPVDKCLMMAIWILGNLDTFRATGVTFGVSRGTVHFHYLVVIEALREMAPRYIKWPSAAERERIRRRIEATTGYSGAVALMDGTLINITAPSIQKERYIDRHQGYSMNVLAVCDDEMLFRDVYIGNPGSVNDTRVFQRSSLHDFLLERNDIVSEEEHILGDGGFELTNKVIIPYRDLGHLTPRETNFNYVHSSIRMGVERAFGRLKGKWRRLFKFYSKRMAYTIDHIAACFVLHNFILLEGREADGIFIAQPFGDRHEREDNEEDEDAIRDEEDEDAIRDEEQEHVVVHPLLAAAKRQGVIKREGLADLVLHHRVNQIA